MDETFSIILEDLQTGSMIDFLETPEYTFFVSDGGVVNDRIVLHLNSTVGIDENEEIANTIYSNRNRIYIDNQDSDSYDIQIVNMMGQVIYEGSFDGNGINSIELNEPTAYYVVRLIKERETITKKLFIVN
jgi:hypothetical protein